MKVLSLLQPWATLVVLGHKKIETRSWNTKYRGPLLIHASKKNDGFNRQLFYQWREGFKLDLPKWEDLPFGAIIGKAELFETKPTDFLLKLNSYMEDGILWEMSEQEKAFGDYSPGRYGWLLSGPEAFSTITPVKGQLGIWEYKGSLNLSEEEKKFVDLLADIAVNQVLKTYRGSSEV